MEADLYFYGIPQGDRDAFNAAVRRLAGIGIPEDEALRLVWNRGQYRLVLADLAGEPEDTTLNEIHWQLLIDKAIQRLHAAGWQKPAIHDYIVEAPDDQFYARIWAAAHGVVPR